jgi:hypothetical protein
MMWQGMKNHPIWNQAAIIVMGVITLACWVWIASRLSDGMVEFVRYLIP